MPGKDVVITVRLSSAEKLWFTQAADAEGISLSAWFRALAHERAQEVTTSTNGDGGGEPAPSFLPGFGLENEEEEE